MKQSLNRCSVHQTNIYYITYKVKIMNDVIHKYPNARDIVYAAFSPNTNPEIYFLHWKTF